MYPVIFLGALRVKTRDEGRVRNKAIYLALAGFPDGVRDILGIWIETTEGAKLWMKVFNDLKTRGVEDLLTPKALSTLRRRYLHERQLFHRIDTYEVERSHLAIREASRR